MKSNTKQKEAVVKKMSVAQMTQRTVREEDPAWTIKLQEMKKVQMVRSHAKDLLKTNPEATIDDLIKRCYFATEDDVFEAIVGTKYSTMYDAHGR